MIPEHFLEPEVRCEWLVDAKMKKIWATQLDLLRVFIAFCDKHGLRHFALGGTLIGAIRHKGFIPWDDDLDMGMPREDYEKFVRLISDELNPPYFLQTTTTDVDYFRLFTRLRNSDTTGITSRCHRFRCNNGIFIDVFPLDSYRATLSNRLMYRYSNFLQRAFEQKMRYLNSKKHTLGGMLLYPISKCINYAKAFEQHQRLCEKISRRQTPILAQVYTATHGYPLPKMLWQREDFEQTVLMDFEYMKIPCPAGYDRMLTTMFKNYMEFPPIEQRGMRHTIEFDPDTPYKQYCHEHYGVQYDD